MGRKAILEKRMKRLEAKKSALVTRAQASQDVNEVRSINEELTDLNAEIEETREEITAIEAEEGATLIQPLQPQEGTEGEARSMTPPQGAQLVNGGVLVGQFGMGATGTQTRENTDPFATMEYRKAFMKYAQTGEKIPTNLYQRDGMPANTNTLGATIPTTVLNEFINEIRLVYGNLYSKVRKLNVPGAVKIPIAELQAQFKWITEDTVSPRQDGGKIDDFVMFAYNMAEIRVSQSRLY